MVDFKARFHQRERRAQNKPWPFCGAAALCDGRQSIEYLQRMRMVMFYEEVHKLRIASSLLEQAWR